MRKIFGIVLLFVQLVPVFSQTPEQVEQMRTAVLQKVQVFTLCLERIGDKSESIDYRSYYMNAALKMFIGQGNAFTEKRLDVSGKEVLIDHGGVNVQIAYDNKPPKRLLVKKYLQGLSQIIYPKIMVETMSVSQIRMSSFQKISDNMYKCVCSFDQKYVGSREKLPILERTIATKVECIITADELAESSDYIIKFGDFTAREISNNNTILN